MPPPRHARKRDLSEPEIVEYLRKSGVSVYLHHEPYDATLGYRGVNYWGEFKTGKKTLKESQELFNDNWRGRKVVVLNTIEQAEEWLESVKNARAN